MPRPLQFVSLAVLGWLAGICAVSPTWAGGNPEGVLLVVNSRSWASLTLANHYQQLRRIPAQNVLYLPYRGDDERVDSDQFRREILLPVLEAIERRGLGGRLDSVAFSADFPWSIDFEADLAREKVPPHLAPIGSLTGLTYLAAWTRDAKPDVLNLESNGYFQPSPSAPPKSHGFQGWCGWAGGLPLEAGGRRFLLATTLGVTSGRGTTVSEAVLSLKRSAAADGTQPTGTIYLVQNVDVRSTTRDPLFPAVAKTLEELGVAAKIINGKIPLGKDDVQGAVLGTADFDWGSSASTIRPGAICEHLTSLGGVLKFQAGQTPLSELIRHGAAGASGAVAEPYAIAQKFPSPWMHVHYARGCTLAESFYQSVAGPYQLLIVGDPLCRPWAVPPNVLVEATGADPVQGSVRFSSLVDATRPARGIGWFLDGNFQHGDLTPADGPDDVWELDTRRIADGFHEIRYVASTDDEVEWATSGSLTIEVDNHDHRVELQATSPAEAIWGQPLRLTAKAAWADLVIFLQGTRQIGKAVVQKGQARLSVDPRILGAGPVRVRALAIGSGEPGGAYSPELDFTVAPPLLPAVDIPGEGDLEVGLELVRPDGTTVVVQDTRPSGWLAEAGVKAGEMFSLNAVLRVPEDDVYQFQIRRAGPLVLKLDDQVVSDAKAESAEIQRGPVGLARGLHRLEIRGQAPESGECEVRFGGSPLAPLDGARFRHLP